MSNGYLPRLPWPNVIHYLRKRNGVSQGQLTLRLGKTQGHWSHVENGDRGMLLDEFIELCELHGESVIVAGLELSRRQSQ